MCLWIYATIGFMLLIGAMPLGRDLLAAACFAMGMLMFPIGIFACSCKK